MNRHMKTTKLKAIPRTLDLRDRLKALIDGELDCLPDLLNGLNDKERLDVILKLIPIVLPKAKPVHYSENEPTDWDLMI